MFHYTGQLAELLLESYQYANARLSLPAAALPQPGQYLQAHSDHPQEILPTSLFAAGLPEPTRRRDEFLLPIAGDLPSTWTPGTRLHMRGPLGSRFALPQPLRRLALVGLDAHPSRLLPVLAAALDSGASVTLFTATRPDNLSLDLEIQPLETLPDALAWADFLVIDLPYTALEGLADLLGMRAGGSPLPAGQALVCGPMPCGGLAECGVCTIAGAQGARFPCRQGPVFDLDDLIG